MARPPEPQRLLNARKFFLSTAPTHLDSAVSLLSPNVVFTVPGHHKLAGVFHGPDEVRRHLSALVDHSKGSFEVLKWIDWMVGETHITALQYAQAQNAGAIYRGHHLYLLESDSDDRLSDIKIFFEDQAAADRFFE
ncbi:MAG: nuclear transport factor 2 family protein [Acidimicrobiales bacterium]